MPFSREITLSFCFGGPLSLSSLMDQIPLFMRSLTVRRPSKPIGSLHGSAAPADQPRRRRRGAGLVRGRRFTRHLGEVRTAPRTRTRRNWGITHMCIRTGLYFKQLSEMHHVYISLFIYLSVYLSIYPLIYLSIDLSIMRCYCNVTLRKCCATGACAFRVL